MATLFSNRGVSTYADEGSAAHSFVYEMGLDWDSATIFGPGETGANFPTDLPLSFGGGPGESDAKTLAFGDGSAFIVFLFKVDAMHPVDPSLRVIFQGDVDRSPAIEHVFEPADSEDNRNLQLHFGDGSVATVRPPGLEDEDLDRPDLLVEPVTQREFERTESLLGVLHDLSESSDLNEEQQRRVRDVIEFLREERNDSEPEKTPRWKLIGTVRVVGRVLSKLPLPAYWATRFIMLVNDIGWTRLAAEYQRFFADIL